MIRKITLSVYIYLNLCIHEGSTIVYDVFGSSEEFFIINSSVVEWEKANAVCDSKNGSLVDLKDLQKHITNNTKLLKINNSSYWSSVSYTPLIVYRGCFSSKYGGKYFVQTQNTVGNCFGRCDWYCNFMYNIRLSNFALKVSFFS
ncbi:uncharacterized protein LOC134236339 [Saccostrea cucullata]|uniref:uncharacterized protein LOC134236339 n=1 Tax=Saccostrea cuccullata TaxID=36930 RepID=UPI002ED3A02C